MRYVAQETPLFDADLPASGRDCEKLLISELETYACAH